MNMTVRRIMDEKMKLQIKYFAVGFISIAIIIAVCSFFSFNKGGKQELEADPVRAIFFCPTELDSGSFTAANALGMLQADTDYENVDVSVYKKDSKNFSFSDEVISAINMKVDALITVGLKDENRFPYLEELKQKNITLCLIDSDSSDIDRFSFVGIDNYQAGKKMGYYLRELFSKEKTEVALFSPNSASAGLTERVNGLREIVENEEQIEVVFSDEATEKTGITIMKKMENVLDTNPDLDVICCMDVITTTYALQILKNRKLTNSVDLIGFDCNDEIADAILNGDLKATFLLQPERMGYETIKILSEHFGEKGPFICHIESQLLTKENIEELWYEEKNR